MKTLMQRNWTGNVRELKNVIERAVLLGSGNVLTATHLGLSPAVTTRDPEIIADYCLSALTDNGIDLAVLLSRIEQDYFKQAMNLSRGNVSKAARLLGLSRDQFRYRFKPSAV